MADLTDEQKRLNEIARADQAKALLTNPIMKAAFDDIERELLAGMELATDESLIRKLHLMFVCNRKVQNTIKTYIDTGKLAAFQLEEKRKFSLFKRG